MYGFPNLPAIHEQADRKDKEKKSTFKFFS